MGADGVIRAGSIHVHWIDLYYSPFGNASWNYVSGFVQNPMGRFMLETTTIAK